MPPTSGTVRYLLPFGFLALVPVGGLLGGAWAFLAALVVPLSLALFDRAIGDEGRLIDRKTGRLPGWFPRTYIVLQLSSTVWVVARIAMGIPPIETFGLIASTGITAGIFGFLGAHELVHSRDRRDQTLGMIFLASVFYMHFRIAHLFGHHRRAATMDDPATARLRESLYAFFVRSVCGQLREAWQHEIRRLGRSGEHGISINNRLIIYLAIEIGVIGAIASMSSWAFVAVAGVALIAVGLLEAFNYVAHYGIRRRRRPNGRFEALLPQHSWNSRRWMNNAALFNMGCHSDHHFHPCRPFVRLGPVAGEAELPSGYAAAVMLAFIPPLWRRVMDPRATAAISSTEVRC